MSPNDTKYYPQRAATERDHAKSSERANVAEIHEELARQGAGRASENACEGPRGRLIRPFAVSNHPRPEGL